MDNQNTKILPTLANALSIKNNTTKRKMPVTNSKNNSEILNVNVIKTVFGGKSPPKTEIFTSFNEFNEFNDKYNIFVNGSEFFKEYKKRSGMTLTKIIDKFVGKYIVPYNTLRNVFTFNIKYFPYFNKFFRLPESIDANTLIAIEYNKTTLLIFISTLEIENDVLNQIYKKHKSPSEVNIYVASNLSNVNHTDSKKTFINMMKLTEQDLQNIKNTPIKSTNNDSLPTIENTSTKPFNNSKKLPNNSKKLPNNSKQPFNNSKKLLNNSKKLLNNSKQVHVITLSNSAVIKYIFRFEDDQLKITTLNFDNFNNYNKDNYIKYTHFLNGNDIMNIPKTEFAWKYVDTFINKANVMRNVIVFNNDMIDVFMKYSVFNILNKTDHNKIIVIDYNKTSLIIFLPMQIEPHLVLWICYLRYRTIGEKKNLNTYVSRDKYSSEIKSNGDLNIHFLDIFKVANNINRNVSSASPSLSSQSSSSSSYSVGNNVTIGTNKQFTPITSQGSSNNSYNSRRKRSSPKFTDMKSIRKSRYDKSKSISPDMLISLNDTGKMAYHDFSVEKHPCTEDSVCVIGKCSGDNETVNSSKTCDNLFIGTHLKNGSKNRIYTLSGITIFETDKNVESVKTIYNILDKKQIQCIIYNKVESPIVYDNLDLQELTAKMFNCSLFIDSMNFLNNLLGNNKMVIPDDLLELFLLNIVFNPKLKLKIAVTFQNHLFERVTRIAYNIATGYYNVSTKMTLKLDYINTLIFSDRCIMIFTPSPSIEMQIMQFGMEIDDYMLFYTYVKKRDKNLRNVYVSKDKLKWVVPSLNATTTSTSDIFIDNNDIKFNHDYGFERLLYVNNMYDYLQIIYTIY